MPDLPAGQFPVAFADTGSVGAYAYRLTIIAAIGGFLFGYDTAVISGAVGLVAGQFGLDVALLGWFVSSALLGCVIGVAYTGLLRDRFGTKTLLLASAALFSISGVGCMLAGGFGQLVAFRLVGGLGIGMASMLSPLYIAEIAPAARRGRLIAFYQVALTVGILVAYFVDAALLQLAARLHAATGMLRVVFVDQAWRGMLGSGAVPSLIFLALLTGVPESPRWLVVHRRSAQALAVLTRINGPEAGRADLAEIQATLATETTGLRSLFGVYRKPALLGVVLALLQQFSGINAVIYYGPIILQRAGFGVGNALAGQVAIGLVNVLGTFVAVVFVDRLGRRPLLLAGGLGTFVSLTLIGWLFHSGGESSLVLLAAIMLFIACFSLSYGPVVWIMLAEIFPTHIRGAGMSLATMALWIGTMLVGQITPWLLDRLHPAGTFWFFALCTLPVIYVCIWMAPETGGRSLEAIERGWRERDG